MIEVLTFAWNAVQAAGLFDKLGGVLKFLVELFDKISPYTAKYSSFVNGIVKITETLGKFRKGKVFSDVYSMRNEMIEYLRNLVIDKDKDYEMDLVRNILISDEKYTPVEIFEVFWDENVENIKGLYKYLFAYKIIEIYIKEDEGDIIVRVINLMIECAVNRYFKH